MIDLRNKNLTKTSTIKTKPTQSKSNDFHFALSDYLFKELKTRGIDVRKNNDLALRIHFGKDESNRHYSLLIDCLDGNIYSSRKDRKDKKIGRLISFKGNRASDAFHCMKKSIEKIIKKLDLYSLLNDIDALEKKASLKRVDLRKM